MHGTVRAVLVFGSDGSALENIFFCVNMILTARNRSGSAVPERVRKTVPTVRVPSLVPGEAVPTVLVSSSGSVPGSSCHCGTLVRTKSALSSKTGHFLGKAEVVGDGGLFPSSSLNFETR